MDKQQIKEYVARRVAKEFKDGDLVNLGIGIPTLASNYVEEGINVTLQSENGYAGAGPAPEEGQERADIVNAGGMPGSITKYGSFFNSATSFGLIRGGHVDMTVLGALQVAQNGDLANYMIPKKLVPGMGGAMDLVAGAKKVIVAMEHTQKGNHKILEQCTLPLTGKGVVDMIITEMGVMEVTEDGLVLTEINPEFTYDEVQEATGCPLIRGEHIIESEGLVPGK